MKIPTKITLSHPILDIVNIILKIIPHGLREKAILVIIFFAKFVDTRIIFAQ